MRARRQTRNNRFHLQYNAAPNVAPRSTFQGFVAKKHHLGTKLLETSIHIRQNRKLLPSPTVFAGLSQVQGIPENVNLQANQRFGNNQPSRRNAGALAADRRLDWSREKGIIDGLRTSRRINSAAATNPQFGAGSSFPVETGREVPDVRP